MVHHSRSCSWCHAMNNLDDPTQRHCKECGHRADLPRMECDCPKCKAGPQPLTQEQVDKALDRLQKGEL